MAPSFIPTEVVGRRRLDTRLSAVVSDLHSLKEAPHVLDREPWRELVDGEAGDVRRPVLGLDLEHAGLVRPSARVRTRLVRERHLGYAVSTATDRPRALGAIGHEADQDREYHDHHPDRRRGGERRREQTASAEEALQRRRAVELAELSGLQLSFEADEEVVAHARGPIRWRTAARPRLTRLRTTASVVPSKWAISPYGRSSITCERIASRCSGLSRSSSA